MNILPSHAPHAALERSVIAELESLGFIVDSATYHDKMKKETVERLREMNCLEAHALRTRADRIAVHKQVDWVFEFECKTSTGRYENMAIEALPFARHFLEHHKIGMPCLYCYRHHDGKEIGFWANNPPDIQTLVIPNRSMHMAAKLIPMLADLRISDIWENAPVGGSGDAFVKVLGDDWRNQRDWRDLVRDALSVRQEVVEDAAGF